MLPAEGKTPAAGLPCEEATARGLKTMRESRENRAQFHGEGLTKMKRPRRARARRVFADPLAVIASEGAKQ
jgi:hypothetical protein